jgi:hypothetical protein
VARAPPEAEIRFRIARQPRYIAADITAPVPTLSPAGLLLALASLLGVGAAAVLRRRRRP